MDFHERIPSGDEAADGTALRGARRDERLLSGGSGPEDRRMSTVVAKQSQAREGDEVLSVFWGYFE